MHYRLFEHLGRLQRLDAALRIEQGRDRPDPFRLLRLSYLKHRIKARLIPRHPGALMLAGA